MNTYINRLTFVFMNLFVVAFAALLGGSILWLLWDGSITVMFPNAVKNGIIAQHLEWWPAVKIVWIFSMLLKTTVETTKFQAPYPAVPSPKPEEQIL